MNQKAKIHYNPGKRCVICEQPFTDLNVLTPAGQKEMLISQVCETCFDYLTAEDENDTVSTTVD